MPELMRAITLDKVREWWAKLPHTQGFWGDYRGTSEEGFCSLFADSPIVVELPFGIIRVGRYQAGDDADIHGVFWSKEALRSTELLKATGQMLGRSLGVKRLTSVVPLRRRSLCKLLETAGFSRISSGPKHFAGCLPGALYAKLV